MYICTITTRMTCHIHVSLSNNTNTIITIEHNLELYLHNKNKIKYMNTFKLSKHNYMVVVHQRLNSL